MTVSAYFDVARLGLVAGGASNHMQMDHFAVRKLPLSTTTAIAVAHALGAALDGSDSALTANPDGDRLDNFGEWTFGMDLSKADDEVAATSLSPGYEGGTFTLPQEALTGKGRLLLQILAEP